MRAKNYSYYINCMNLYLRFFNDEVLVENVDQAIAFLEQLSEVHIDETLRRDLARYVESNNLFPKRFKVTSKSYFIVIKTTATTMEEFKAYANGEGVTKMSEEKEKQSRAFTEENPGWYKAEIKFKRVLVSPDTNKCHYVDTDFEAKLKAHSVQDCYDRVVDYLRNRVDVDPRSQYPSIRGRNFKAEYLGM